MIKTTTKIINDSVVSLIRATVKLCVVLCVLFSVQISRANTLPPCTLVLGTPTSTPVNCFNQTSPNGTATVTITTGSGSYSYLWNDGQTAQTASGLSASTYTVTVTDNIDICTATTTVVVTQPTPVLNYIINGANGTQVTLESCPGSADGTATANASGGNGGYTFSWTPTGQTTQTATGLSAGTTYFVTVRDSKGCTGVARTVSMTTSLAITIAMSNTSVSCNGGATGTATATPSNGTLPHTYAWSGTTQTGATVTGLAQGIYTVTVTDNNGCTKTATTTITEPTPVTASVTNTSVLCNGGSTGTATVTPGGGTGAKTYLWSFGNQTTTTAIGLPQGTYTVTVTDANNCTVTTTTTITEPTPLTASATNTSVLCNGGNTGTATVTPGGGTGIKTILWSAGGQTGLIATGLIQGTYTVTVTDANNCTITTTTTVTEPTPVTASVTNTSVLCNGGNTGTATVTPGGGIGTKTVLWSAGGQTTLTATGLSQGTYTVTVTDANNCTRTATTVITEPLVITINNTPTNLTCFNYGNGRIVSSPTGGTGGFQYSWMPGGLTGATANNLAAGTYSLTVTDANNCTRTATTSVTEPPSPITGSGARPLKCNILDGDEDGKAWVTPRGTLGPYQYNWLPNPSGSLNDSIFDLSAGNYTVTVTDNQGCKQSTVVIVTQPPAISATITPTNVGCNTLGSISVSATGGNSTTYTYSWSANAGGQTTATITNLTPNNYQVTISDSKGCTVPLNAEVKAPQPIIIQNPSSNNIVQETCENNNGSITMTAADVSGGTTPYTYTWNTGNTTNQLSNISAGTYTVTVYDNQGCSSSRTLSISNQNSPPSAFASNVNQISCFGANNGSATVLASAGSGAGTYTYAWAPAGGVGATASNLSPGTYTVTVTDANNCTATSTTTIIEPTQIIINPLSSNATCGVNNGSASVSPTGGTLPHTYIWTNGETTASITGLSVGTYTVTITDLAGCTKTAGFSIVTSNPISLTASSTNINCFGVNTGTATATALSGGSGIYNYAWSPGGAVISNPTGLAAGTYTVTVSESGNPTCFGTSTVIITQPTSALTLTLSSPNVTCFGNTNGQVNSTPNGGTSPYTYSWNNTSTASGLTGLGVGTYTLTVTDNNGCTITATESVTENPEILASTTKTNVTCFGNANGTATVNASGGNGTLTYNWSPSGGNGITASNLAPNTYTITVRDANNCSKTATATITEPPTFTISNIVPTNPTCGNSNGTAVVSVTGGSAPYVYAWSNGDNSETASNLGVGTFTVNVNDANNCVATGTIAMVVSNPLTIPAPTKTNITCNGNDDGTITINPTGGTTVYNYIWAPGGNTTNNPTGLSPATYTVTVTDAGNAGCSSTATVIITQPAILATNPSSTNITCNGSNNGIASVAPTGGNTPYTYAWNNASTVASITGLSPATYTVTVTDNKGCTETAAIPITQGSALTITPGAITDVSCSGGSNGASSVSITGGTGAYTYSWSPAGGTAAAASGLPANIYTVSVRDGNNCNSTITITITQPAPLTITPSSTNANCGLSNGDATAAPAGGTLNYNYIWTNGNTNPTANGLAPGAYRVTVTDANNCTATQNYNIVVANPLVLQTNKADVSCNAGSNGMTTVTVTSGGTGTFNYAWLPGGAGTQTVNGLSAGTYIVTITDAINNACTATASVVVNQPNPISPNITPTPISCFGTSDGTVTSAPTGGIPGYSYIYSPGGSTAQTTTGLAPGAYTVQVTDNNSCTATAVATVLEPTLLTITQTQTNITCTGALDGTININPDGGTVAYTYAWAPAGSGSSIGGLGPGTYTITVTDASGCIASSTIVITEPPAMSTNIVGVNPTCYVNNGSAFAEVTGGGVGPFTYEWAPGGATSQTITNQPPGTYSVTINDTGTTTGCPTTLTVTLDFPQITLTFGSQNVLCAGDANGKLWVTPNGGTAGYTYTWNTTETTDTIRSLVQGTYTVTVFDNGGCSATATQTITQPAPLVITTATPTNVNCFGGNTGDAAVTPGGGTIPYTYLWDNGTTNSSISNLMIGNYSVTITDANLCSVTTIINITEPPVLSVTADSVNVTCFNVNNGQANATGNGGVSPYTYNWMPGSLTGSNLTNLSPGTYTVTIIDANSCTATDTISIIEPNLLTVNITKTDANCGQNNGVLIASPSGGNISYTYSWSNGATSATISSLTPIGYTVTVTDEKGCSATSSATITEPDAITLNLTSTNVICNAADNGTATATVTGGSLTYNYTWNASAVTVATLNNLTPGTYTVTVSDQNNAFCTLTATTTITQPDALTIVNPTITNLTCNGAGNGSISLTVSGGITNYSYTWSSGESTANISGLPANGYTITITDANNCTLVAPYTITEPGILTVGVTAKNISCNGYNDGEVYAAVTGGTAPFNYVWNNAIINDTLKNLSPNTYTITVTDQNACTVSNTISITEPAGMTLIASKTNTACGTANGTAKVVVTGGNAPHVYNWSNGGTTATITGLFKGKYIVTVTDNTGCIKIDSVNITEPNGIKIQFNITNSTCNGSNNGQITVSATGGTGSYSFTWIASGNTNTTITNLIPGKYKVLVRDANNTICAASDSAFITEPAVLTASPINGRNISCNGAGNGRAITSPTGGTAPYNYLWTNNSTNDTINNLVPATYTVTVTDNKGCTTTSSISITEPTPLTSIASNQPADCGSSNGEASVVANGGISPYFYSWSPVFSTANTVTNLLPGKYYVTIFDSNNCTKTDSTTITISDGITTLFNSTSPGCNGESNGQTTVSANGGSGNFIYLWQPGGNTNPTLFGITAGYYTVTITDVNINGCNKIDSVLITEPAKVLGNVVVTKTSCSGTNDYLATANITGGTGLYTFEWSGTGIAGSVTTAVNQLSNLGPGSYGVYVSDANGCDTTFYFNINPQAPPSLTIRVFNAKCNLPNGRINAIITSGPKPFSYTWSPTITNSTIKTYPSGNNDTIFTTGLAVGSYTITVTDAFNCTATAVRSIINTASPPTIMASNTPVSCPKGNDGTLSSNASNGTMPFFYTWGPSGGSLANASGLSAGTYTVTVSDGQGCTATSSTTIPQPDSIVITKSIVNASCFASSTGSATITNTTGGTPLYNYTWSSGSTTDSEINLAANLYTITITDSRNCVQLDTFRITQPPLLKLTSIIINNVSCTGGTNGSIKIKVEDGTPAYTYNWQPFGGTDSIAPSLSQGSYTVSVTDANGCGLTTAASVTEPSTFSALVEQKNISCFGGNDGKAKVTITGSNKPYIFSWQPVSSFNDSIENLTAGAYTLNVIDSLGCTYNQIVDITQPPLIVTNINKIDITCFGAGDGTAIAHSTGGTRPFNFTWDNSPSIDSIATNLTPGTYSVFVTDINGCKDTSSITITEPIKLEFTPQKTDLNCFNDSVGTITVNATGGNPTYTYNWSNGVTTSTNFNLKAGDYMLTLTDTKNCIYIDTINIEQPTPVIANTSQVDVLCFGKNTGSATLTPTGGTPGYNYSWSNGVTSDNISNITSGTYKYSITDSKGCLLKDSILIIEAQPVVLNTAGLLTKCFNSCDGQAVVIPSNGITPYTFSWSNGGTNPSISNICTGIYTIEVTDANGCIATSNVFVPEPTPLVITPSSNTAHCDKADGSATIDASGATAPYAYTWNIAGQIDSTIQNQIAGTYTVTVTDLNNCSLTTSITVGNASAPLASITSFTNTICSNACAGQAVSTVTGGTGTYTYSWNTNPAQLTANAQNLCIGDFILSVTDAFGCSDTANITIKSPAFDINLATLDTNICFGQTASLNATASGGLPNYNFTWMPGNLNGNNVIVSPTTDQSYTVMVTDANGCQFGPDSILVKVKDPLIVTAVAAPPAACPNTPTTITVSATGGTGIYTFTWQPNNYVGTSIVIAPSTTTTYTITGFDGCTVPNDTATITVFVYPDPVPNFSSLDTILCVNTCIDFTDLSTVGAGSFINQWEWNFGDGQTSNQQNPTHCYELLGQYNVSLKVTTDKGCNKFITKQNFVDVIGIPTAAFDMSSNYIGSKDATVKFTDKSIDAVSWEWNFGDNSYNDSINNTQNPKHTYQDTGTYTVRLIVKNAQGCTDTTTKDLRVYPEWTFFIPNAFSPNGDGINDFFNGKGTFIKKYRMMVFDRWGELIYVTESLTESWNGKANYGDEMAQQDVYVWKVALTDVFDVEHKLIGHVTLVK